MRFGIYAGPLFPGERELSSREVFERAVKLSETAQASGFEGIFVGTHYLVGDESQILNPVPILSYLAGRCPGLYLATCVYLLPFHHPITVAEEMAMLDLATGGRFLFGVGQGYREIEFTAQGMRRDERGRRMAEGIRAIRALWSAPHTSFHGEFYNFDDVSVSIRPFIQQGPPILVAADTMTTVKRVPEIADYWIVSPRHSRTFLAEAIPAYRAELERHERPFNGLFIPREMYVARTRREAEDTIKKAFEEMYHRYHQWGQPGERYDQDFEALKRERLIVGSPADVTEQILGYHRDFGAEFMWFRLYWPGLEIERSLDAIRLFGAEVLPVLKRETGEGRLP